MQTRMAALADRYWKMRLQKCKIALEKNRFEVFLADSAASASRMVLGDILPNTGGKTISWGDSMTLHATRILEALRQDPRFEVLVTFDPGVSREELIERRRRALLVDVFLTGTNAVTETGTLVNLDMIGNRVAGITFGPRHVIILVGRNKIVPDLTEALRRIKNYSAPVNVIRHPGFKAPCAKTALCADCKSTDRICNAWTIIERSFPRGRIKVVLINRDLGL